MAGEMSVKRGIKAVKKEWPVGEMQRLKRQEIRILKIQRKDKSLQ
jgi:hypothetical protein